MIQRIKHKKIGILGLSFKQGTDDLRESPMVHLVERLLGKGYDLRIYDRQVSMAKVIGANKQYIEQVIPHISTLLVSNRDQILDHSEILVVGNNTPEFRDIANGVENGQHVIDLARVERDISRLNGNYQGICW
jgi:GDP-mannose 6-dehydrogenase